MSRPDKTDLCPAPGCRNPRIGQGAKARVARLVSIVLHPVVAMAAAAAVAAGEGASPRLRAQALAAVVMLAAIVMGYSVLKARSGAWGHIDASHVQERAQFNRFASCLLAGASAALALAGVHAAIVATVALSGAIVLAGHLMRSWSKASLHVAFVAFAALIVWPQALATGIGLAATAAVAWSRLALSRHVVADIVAGAVLGLAAGIALHACLSR